MWGEQLCEGPAAENLIRVEGHSEAERRRFRRVLYESRVDLRARSREGRRGKLEGFDAG